MPISRRRFLGAAAATGIGIRVGVADLLPSVAEAATGPPLASAPLIAGAFPRAFTFRQCEVLAQLRTYPQWEATFLALGGGIMGKALTEERTDTVSARNAQYFARYKFRHPEQVVLLHYNGVARRPSYRTNGWYAGDWLYTAGTSLTQPIDDAATTLPIADPSVFTLVADGFGNVGADLVLTGRTAAGAPDFDVAEHLVLSAIDAAAGTITVQRGAYGSTPLSLDAGAYVAQHVSAGPYAAADERVWLYNFSTVAPRAADGTSVGERIAAEMQSDFGVGGLLVRLDGVELDTFRLTDAQLAELDADGDGVADGAVVAGVDTYVAGQADFVAQLRAALGGRRLVLADGGLTQQPDTTRIDGIEVEGFPTLTSTDLSLWPQAMSAVTYWSARARPSVLTYPLVKTSVPGGEQTTDFARFRVTLAASLLAGSGISFFDEPGGDGSLIGLRAGSQAGIFPNTFTIWDELVCGTAGTPQWLGMPSAPPVYLATAGPDLYGGAGINLNKAFMAGLAVTGGTVTRAAGPVLLITPDPASDLVKVSLPTVSPTGPDQTTQFDLLADADPAMPSTGIVRLVNIAYAGSGYPARRQPLTAGTRWFTTITNASGNASTPTRLSFYLDNVAPVRLRRITAYDAPYVAFRAFANGAVFVNPSPRPYTFDVASLVPGRAFARITATAGQDSTTNDGSAIGEQLTIPPSDALIVRAA